MHRRHFLAESAAALGSLMAVEGIGSASADESASRTEEAEPKAGRPVRAVSIGFRPGIPLQQISDLVDQEGARGADLIALPETCRGQNDQSPESLDGPTVSTLARVAGKHRTYIVCPIDRNDGGRRLNSAVLIDRRGQVAAVYDKLYPYGEEFTKHPGVQPGQAVTVHQTDFGRVGLAICFDVNWAPLWQRLSDLKAEMVIWPSAYSAGRSLAARAIDFNYYVMSATWTPDCLVFDIDGEQLLHENSNRPDGINVSRYTFDLDRCLFHQDYNLPHKLANLLKDHGDDVEREKWLPMEGWFVLRAKRPGVSARELARRYGLEERRPYINRCRCDIDKARGWQFS
ncbi:MAG TPA: carbon-nitrogen hydrolase family protein [Bryobacteraceae bacterium]|nr:carbon-nitrogen hydrolase family protein [Bryobacteraceae bacterium]